VEALNKSASYRDAEAAAGQLTHVSMGVRETGKVRRSVSLPLCREDEGELAQ
jgi:hypothetical protein